MSWQYIFLCATNSEHIFCVSHGSAIHSARFMSNLISYDHWSLQLYPALPPMDVYSMSIVFRILYLFEHFNRFAALVYCSLLHRMHWRDVAAEFLFICVFCIRNSKWMFFAVCWPFCFAARKNARQVRRGQDANSGAPSNPTNNA